MKNIHESVPNDLLFAELADEEFRGLDEVPVNNDLHMPKRSKGSVAVFSGNEIAVPRDVIPEK